uniref:cation:proton antiporter n=2 Tax=Psychromonas algarum TaxID=2555643 RepID=UPI001FBB5AC8|nr:cation:proton antiporter [Psychromonas sp. RZ22]
MFYWLSQFFSLSWQQSFTVASVLTMSSTAVIIKVLSDQQRLHSESSKLTISVLLFQDLAVVPFLIIIPIIAMPELEGQLLFELGFAFIKGLFAVVILLAVGRWVLPLFFDEVGKVRFDEIFILSTLFITILASAFTQYLGLSMALGAFLAGMMLAESHYRNQLLSDIRPFKDILMAMFFVSIGTLLDAQVLANNLGILFILVVVVIAAKIFTVAVAAILMKENISTSLGVGIALAQMGEFGFILVALATKYHLLDEQLASLILATGVISMSLTPLLVQYSQKISKEVMHHSEKVFGLNKTLPGQFTEHTIICGYGRVGQIVSRFLKMESLPFIVLDRDPMRVKEARKGGENIEFGDASRRDILLIAGLEKAKLLIITFDDLQRSKALLEVIRPINPDIKVLVRTKSDRGLAQLKAAGATAVVPEVLEGSLMMVAHVLLLSGVSHRKIMRRMDDERKMQYENLHGFYYGELEQTKARFSDNSEFDEVEKLHAVRLPTLSEFIGKPISSFKVKGVIIKKLQREGGQVIKIKPASCFKVNDLLLLLGEQQNLEKADTLLLKVREAPSK